VDGLPRTAVLDPPGGRGTRDVPWWAMLVGAVLWVAAAVVMAGVVVSRYRGAIGVSQLTNGANIDFLAFCDAGRPVTQDANLFLSGGVYDSVVALSLVLPLAALLPNRLNVQYRFSAVVSS